MYGRNPYKKAQASTATPGELVVMLYDGILRFADHAAVALSESDYPTAGMKIGRAIDIINYLQTILDTSQAPELGGTLDGLYTFWIRQLTKANLTRSPGPITEIRSHIQDLRDAWQQASLNASRDELQKTPR